MKKGKYLITGCAGFIGSCLVKSLYKNYDLILVDDLSKGNIKNLPKGLRHKIIKKKIKSIKKINTKKIKGIFHLAAQPIVKESYKNPYNTLNTNINGTINILETIRKINRKMYRSAMRSIWSKLAEEEKIIAINDISIDSPPKSSQVKLCSS